MDRETLSLPVANSQFYTAAVSSITSLLSPIAQVPVEKEEQDTFANSFSASAPPSSLITANSSAPLFELTEEVRNDNFKVNKLSNLTFIFFQLTPKRPLRSEAEKEKRLSRTQSIVASTSSKIDNASMSGESSNSRNSISKFFIPPCKRKSKTIFKILVTTDSQTSEEDSMPPPLPMKNRDSEVSSLLDDSQLRSAIVTEDCYQTVSRALPVTSTNTVVNAHYEILEIKNREVIFAHETKSKKNPPTPPPKPHRASRDSRGSFSP